jgi:hypothetical protein
MDGRTERNVLAGLDLFAAISAIGGGIGLLIGVIPLPLSLLNGTPFTSYVIPALILMVVVGGSALAATIALLHQEPAAPTLSAVAGLIMIGWISVEVALLGLITGLQPFYFAVGLAMLALGLRQLGAPEAT